MNRKIPNCMLSSLLAFVVSAEIVISSRPESHLSFSWRTVRLLCQLAVDFGSGASQVAAQPVS